MMPKNRTVPVKGVYMCIHTHTHSEVVMNISSPIYLCFLKENDSVFLFFPFFLKKKFSAFKKQSYKVRMGFKTCFVLHGFLTPIDHFKTFFFLFA